MVTLFYERRQKNIVVNFRRFVDPYGQSVMRSLVPNGCRLGSEKDSVSQINDSRKRHEWFRASVGRVLACVSKNESFSIFVFWLSPMSK